jgi:aminopeptidase YwaD
VRHLNLICILFVVSSANVCAHTPPLLQPREIAALANELSGEIAKRNLEGLARLHRQRGSEQFHAAAELVVERARAYGLDNAQVLRFPADGHIFYGTQLSRMAWDASEGELSEVTGGRDVRIASLAAEPVALAEDSESAEVTTELVDVGDGSSEADYAGRDVRGKIVLVGASPAEAQDLAVSRFGAVGMVSYQQNQKTAWSGDNDNLVRWGHLQSFSADKTFAFMVSLKTARGLRERLRRGDEIRLHATVHGGQHPGFYEIVTATIEGSDTQLKNEEIAFSCHLDHQRPGANDNASGCVTILEVARTLQALIGSGALARPTRTIRFIWPPEVEGTVTLLNARPELTKRIKAVVHMDMVGGGPDTKAVFHVTRGPLSLPSFVHDVAWAFASWVNQETYEFAATDKAEYPLIAPEGGKEPLRAMYAAYTMGSDHDVYQDSSFAIPAIYLNDWPDRYIHTNFDTASNIDPTKLKRAAFIGAASGYFLANLAARDTPAVNRAIDAGKLLRMAASLERDAATGPAAEYERGVIESLRAFGSGQVAGQRREISGATVFRRAEQPRGPLTVFGYDYFTEHAKSAGIAKPGLLSYEGEWGSGEEYAYEALNLANGQRTGDQICTLLSSEYGRVPPQLVLEYLQALKRLGIVR